MVTKYYSVEPKEKSLALYSPSDKGLTLDFDIFGFNGIGYEQKLDIYMTHTKQPRIYTGVWMPKQKDQLFTHFIGLYDKGIGLECSEGDPSILFDYKILYKENEDILDRSFAELYYATEFFLGII